MTRAAIHSPQAPAAIGPYSQAIESGGWLFVSGQIGLDPQTGGLVGNHVEAQTRQAIENLKSILQAANTSFEHVVRTTIYLTDMTDFVIVGQIYGAELKEPYPARATVQVAGLPRGACVEIDAIARVP